MNKFIHNISGETKNYGHGDIADGAFWEVPTIAVFDRLKNLPSLLADFSSGIVKFSRDGSADVAGESAKQWNSFISREVLDSNTGGLAMSPKWAPDGWHQQYFETEFQTSDMSATSIHEKDWLNSNIGFSTLKFYDASENLLTTQEDIDTLCVRTDLLWMPTFDYAIKSGYISQKEVPASNMYVWVVGADLDAAYGGPQAVFAEGGINLTYVDARVKAGLDGVAATILYYTHPQLGGGAGTNRLRFIVRHAAGMKHRIQAVMEIFVA